MNVSLTLYHVAYDPDGIVDGELPHDAERWTDALCFARADYEGREGLLEAVIAELCEQGLAEGSQYPLPDDCSGVWLSTGEPYRDVYTGECAEVSAHLESGLTGPEWTYVVRRVLAA